MSLPVGVRREFLRFCGDEPDVARFEAWLCQDREAEACLGPDVYLELISANYHDVKGALLAVRETVVGILEREHPGALERYRAGCAALALVEERVSLAAGTRRLAEVSWDHRHPDAGCQIPDFFAGVQDEPDLDFYASRIDSECRLLLERLRRFADWIEPE